MNASDPPGPIAGLRRLAANLLGGLKERLALLSLEVEEERSRLLVGFAWITAAMIAALLTLLMASVTIVFVFWDSARLAVLIGLTALYLSILVTVVIVLRRHLARQPRPFAASMAELEADQENLREEA